MKIKIYSDETFTDFPIYVSTVGFNYKETKLIREEGYCNPQVFCVESGSGILSIGGKTYPLQENDMFFIDENIPHEYYCTDDNFKTSFISFFGDGFLGIKKYFEINDFEIYKNKNNGVFSSYVERIYKLLDSPYELPNLCALTFSAVVAFFYRCCKKEYNGLEAVNIFLEKHYSAPITLDDLHTIYPYSKTKLCKDFKEKYNVTIFQMLNQIRLNHAKHMISNNPNLKLKDIAKSCGFNDVSYFCKTYKKLYNNSPKTKK